MIKYRKSFGIILLVFILLGLNNSSSSGQELRLKGGFVLSDMLSGIQGSIYHVNYNMRPGFMLGASATFAISGSYFLEIGAGIGSRGYRFRNEYTILGFNAVSITKVGLNYFEIPITVGTGFSLMGKQLHLAIGPGVGIGMFGHVKSKNTVDGETTIRVQPVEWGASARSNEIKRVDFGLNASLGVDLNTIGLAIQYNLGLSDISNSIQADYRMKNRVLALVLNYQLGSR